MKMYGNGRDTFQPFIHEEEYQIIQDNRTDTWYPWEPVTGSMMTHPETVKDDPVRGKHLIGNPDAMGCP